MRRLFSFVACAALGCTDPQKASWGLGAITTLTTPADPPFMCGVALPSNSLGDQRAACTFGSGALPQETLGIDPATVAKIPIRHVIVMMKENRSFDHLFGFPAGFTNPDLTGAMVAPFHATTTCIPTDPGHQSTSMNVGVDDGKMDGWVKNAATTTGTDGHFVMSNYQSSDLPFYFFLKDTFALNERHFAPVISGTFANRNYMMFGDNAGAVDTGIVFPQPTTPSLLQLLMSAGVTWGAYTDDLPFSSSLDWSAKEPGVHPLNDLFDALDKGTLPNVAFVDGREDIDDDHPVADLQKGEAWVKRIYDHAIASPQWQRLAIIWVYDEGGGFADHVSPPRGVCRSMPTSPYVDLGVRVPLVAISPWAKRGFVSDVQQDHTAVTRFIALLFGLPALTGRDANSPALLDLFDFSCGRDLSVPAAPMPGTGGCANPP